jgi:hypothetical protein
VLPQRGQNDLRELDALHEIVGEKMKVLKKMKMGDRS